MDKHRIFENGDTVVLGLFCFSLNKLSWWSYETDNYIYVRQGLLNRLFALEQKGHFFPLGKKKFPVPQFVSLTFLPIQPNPPVCSYKCSSCVFARTFSLTKNSPCVVGVFSAHVAYTDCVCRAKRLLSD